MIFRIRQIRLICNTRWLAATSTVVKMLVPEYNVEGLIVGDSMTPIANISKHGHITAQGTITSTGELSAPNIYTNTAVNNLVAT